ncbi:TolB family protein [Alkalihalobacillus sp. 1P02AB]|uniref:TolB family protein n=1 Tax=Alkalihalobacillus sp. 1P02AB TaxID=3132260 RepID=UPI0039A61211
MQKIIIIILLFILFAPTALAKQNDDNLKVAFIREQTIWIKTNKTEEKIVSSIGQNSYSPQWSYDGKKLLYLKESGSLSAFNTPIYQLWVYDLESKKHQIISEDAQNPKWSPTENLIAFQTGGVLNISDLTNFFNITLGVSEFEWQPDGEGFILSSAASLLPTGWTHANLYTVSIAEGYQTGLLMEQVKLLYSLPNQVTNGHITVPSISASTFSYSPDGRWISFIITPTASLSMDSNMLAVISNDGQNFETVDEVILNLEEPKWARQKNLLGYIAGGGRIVFGFKNKDLKIKELPAFSIELTPENHVDLGFSWINDHSLITVRAHESDWSNEPTKRPPTHLMYIPLNGDEQKVITKPPKGKSDRNPEYLPLINKLSWLRVDDFATSGDGDLWLSELDGTNAKVWINDVKQYTIFLQ